MRFLKNWTKNKTLILLLSITFLTMPFAKHQVEAPKLGKHSPILRVLASNGRTVCSAFVVSEHYAISAGHCIDPYQTDIAVSNDDLTQVVNAKVMSVDMKLDQALLIGDFSSFKPLVMGSIEGKASLKNCGYAFGGDLVCFDYKPDYNLGFMLKGKGYLYPVMSGGPLFDVKTNTVVGINVAVKENDLIHSPLVNFWSRHGF